MPEASNLADDATLVGLARACMELAYAPYSGYRVGAALLTGDGTVVTGCNVENMSYGLSLCAERVAVARAIALGKQGFRTIVITTDGYEAVAPCGSCRQVLAEFELDLRVVSEGLGARREWTLRELLPEPFDALPGWLGRKDDEST